MWSLPRDMLRPKLSALEWTRDGKPPLPPQARPQEWFGGGWLFRCQRQRKLYQYCVPSRGARKLIPCERACDFLVPHYGGGKYAYGNGSEWMDLGPDRAATLATALGQICGDRLDSRCMGSRIRIDYNIPHMVTQGETSTAHHDEQIGLGVRPSPNSSATSSRRLLVGGGGAGVVSPMRHRRSASWKSLGVG